MTILANVVASIGIYPFRWIILGILAFAYDNRMRARRRNPKQLPLPPGPKGLPVLGSVFDMPREKSWLVYDDWCKIYGDMVYFEVLGQPFLILGSLERTRDLFDRRSSNYSDRPRLPMLVELMDWAFSMAFMPYGQWWRRHRKTVHNHFHPNVVWKYKPVQQREVRVLLHRLLNAPEDFMELSRHMFAATIMKVVYGITVKDSADPYVSAAEELLEGLTASGVPGAFLVDVLPILKYVPSWVPGAGFQRKAAHWKKFIPVALEKPFQHVENELRNGNATPSMAVALIEQLPDPNHPLYAEEKAIGMNITSLAYLAGADTTLAAVHTFLLAMALHPDVQRKAQAELDRVVGPKRLPDFNDYDSLPYINAIAKETMRWHPVAPLGFAHMSSQDDEYDGFFIPRGTIVLGHAWAILHDPAVFSDPLVFQPERFLKDGKLDPNVRNPDCAAFGFGRRICPGRHLSNNWLYSVISSVLAVYDITPPLDDLGNPMEVKPEFSSGLLSHPLPFKCTVKPRGPLAETLIRDQCFEMGREAA